MEAYEKLISSIDKYTPYLEWARQGLTPEQVKAHLFALLKPFFRYPERLETAPLSALAYEAIMVSRITASSWASEMFAGVLSEYHGAFARNEKASIEALIAWDESAVRATSEFMSIYLMEVDKSQLGLEEFKLEILRNIGGMLEACLQPHLKALLHQNRIRRGRKAVATNILAQTFGSVVEELNKALAASDLMAPPPWGIKLHQWRNIAQHHAATVRGDVIVCSYQRGSATQEIVLSRSEFLVLAHILHGILGIVRAARSIFILDCDRSVSRDGPELIMRTETSFLEIALAIATQGFEVVKTDVDEEMAHLFVRDVTHGDSQQRMLHASQFVVMTWQVFHRPKVRVTYMDNSGQERLETTATGTDCEEIAEQRIKFASLAQRVEFRVIGQQTKNA